MTIYLDSSALVKRYVDEPDSDRFRAAIDGDARRTTSRITFAEVGRALVRAFGAPADDTVVAELRDDLAHMAIADVDAETCSLALDVARETGVRTLDAIHLATLWKVGRTDAMLLTADRRQARAAVTLGLRVHPVSTT